MTQYEIFELKYQLTEPALTDSAAAIDLSAEFEFDGEKTTVKGFYDGDGCYKLRFLPLKAGQYSYRVSGIVSDEGRAECMPAEDGAYPPVRARGMHFYYDSGKPFYPFGTTVYALAHQPRELIEATISSLEKSPFNKVRFCVFPKDYDYNKNDPEYYAFEKTDGRWDVNKPCIAFWRNFESIIERLGRSGIQCDIILFHPYDRWGFSRLSKAESLIYLDYAIRRLSAYPNVWWSLANEYDLMHGYKPSDWVYFAAFIKENDPCRHLLSNHNCFNYFDFTLPEVTHCSIQDINVNEVPELAAKYKKPIMFDEICYEGNINMGWGNISAFELTNRFWTAVISGAYCTHGETYLSGDDILWWSKGGVLKGESPERIGFLRRLVEAFPSPIDYCPEGVAEFTKEKILDFKKNGIPEKYKYDFWARGLSSLPEERISGFIIRSRGICGACQDGSAMIWYYGRTCPAFNYITLPEGGSYRVEVIDAWEMTRTTVLEDARGTVRVDLPGKEGIAVLAVRV